MAEKAEILNTFVLVFTAKASPEESLTQGNMRKRSGTVRVTEHWKGFLERLWSLLPWRYSEVIRTQS